MKKIFLLIFLPLWIFAKTNPADALIDNEITFFTFNKQFDQAYRLIDQQIKSGPGNPKYQFFYITARIIESIHYIDEHRADRGFAIRDSIYETVVKYAENELEKIEPEKLDTEGKFYLSGIYGYLGRMHGAMGNWVSAFGYAKDAINLVEEVLEEDPALNDAYVVSGMFNYFGDRMSGFTGFIAGILGFSGDRQIGLKHLKIAYEKGTHSSPQAAIMLMEIYSRMETNQVEAFPVFDKFIKDYPENDYVLNWYLSNLIDMNMIEKAGKIIEERKDLVNPLVSGVFLHKAGRYKESSEMLNKAFGNRSRYRKWMIEAAVFYQKINYLVTGTEPDKFTAGYELSDRYLKTWEVLKKDKEFTGVYLNTLTNSGQQNYPDENRFTGSQKELLICAEGINEYLSGNSVKAEGHFRQLLSSSNKMILDETYKHLLYIYKTGSFKKETVEDFVDKVYDQDNDRLEYAVRDLEIKYNL